MINQDWAILLVIIVLFLIFSRQGQSALDNLLSTLCPLVYLLASGFYYLLSKKNNTIDFNVSQFKKKSRISKIPLPNTTIHFTKFTINELNFRTYPHNRHFHQDTYHISQLFYCLINFIFIFLLSSIKRCSLSFCCLFQNFIK